MELFFYKLMCLYLVKFETIFEIERILLLTSLFFFPSRDHKIFATYSNNFCLNEYRCIDIMLYFKAQSIIEKSVSLSTSIIDYYIIIKYMSYFIIIPLSDKLSTISILIALWNFSFRWLFCENIPHL